MRTLAGILTLGSALAGQAPTAALGADLNGYVALQGRGFPRSPLNPVQPYTTPSASAQVETRWRWGPLDLEFTPFGRLDASDRKRTHADIRKFSARLSAWDWDWHIGIGKVFWGVAESHHLVDVVNQTDFVEDIDEEAKLGQPMLHASRLSDWGTLELFVLPGFRERTYPGEHGRLYLPIDTEHPVYESDKKR
jgi:hypothetical protein